MPRLASGMPRKFPGRIGQVFSYGYGKRVLVDNLVGSGKLWSMAARRPPANNNHLEEAMALLIRNQAAFVEQIARNDQGRLALREWQHKTEIWQYKTEEWQRKTEDWQRKAEVRFDKIEERLSGIEASLC